MALAHQAVRILYWYPAMQECEGRKKTRGVRRPWHGHAEGHSLLWLAQLFYEIISKNIYHLTSFQLGKFIKVFRALHQPTMSRRPWQLPGWSSPGCAPPTEVLTSCWTIKGLSFAGDGYCPSCLPWAELSSENSTNFASFLPPWLSFLD